MLTVEEVAAILKVQPLTVRQMFRESRIRGFKIGKAWRTTMPILEEDIACMSRGVKAPRLEQAASATDAPASPAEAAPVRKRRAKAVPAPVEPAAPEAAQEAEPVSAAVAEASTAEEVPVGQEVPAAEEPETGGKRRKKSVPEEHTEQQLLF